MTRYAYKTQRASLAFPKFPTPPPHVVGHSESQAVAKSNAHIHPGGSTPGTLPRAVILTRASTATTIVSPAIKRDLRSRSGRWGDIICSLDFFIAIELRKVGGRSTDSRGTAGGGVRRFQCWGVISRRCLRPGGREPDCQDGHCWVAVYGVRVRRGVDHQWERHYQFYR